MSDTEGTSYAEILVGLHQLIESEERLTDSLRRCAQIAQLAVPGVEAVGLTLRTSDSGTTVACSAEIAPQLDDAQYEADSGPCLEAFRNNEVLHLERIAEEGGRWPEFATRAAELGIHSSLSIPLRRDGDAVGALNLYASPPRAFSPPAVETAKALGVQASIAVTNAEVYWRARHLVEDLTRALDDRDVLGQAKGIVMRARAVTDDAAWELIRDTAAQRRTTVSALARRIVEAGDLPNA